MAAPLLAAAARLSGPAVRSTGGKWMHSSSSTKRKVGSRMLKVKDKQIESLQKIAKHTDMSVKFLGKIGKSLQGIAQHSPALKQQLIIMSKGISVIIRPIGDILAKFVRPMAVWVMKVAQTWYKKFGLGGGADSKAAKEDAVNQAEKQLESAIAGGNPEMIAAAQSNLTQKRSELEGDGNKDGGFMGKLKDAIGSEFMETLSALGGAFEGIWETIKGVGAVLWEIFEPALKAIAAIAGGILLIALNVLKSRFESIEQIFKLLGASLQFGAGLLSDWKDLFENIGKILVDKFITALQDWWEAIKNIWNIITNIKSWDDLLASFGKIWAIIKENDPWLNFKETLEDVWSTVTEIVNKAKKFLSSAKDRAGGAIDTVVSIIKPKSSATGGAIDTTGLYRLHAGERVIPAGEVARQSGGSTSISNYITLQATINHDIDINELARKLAKYNETQLRRRVSYM